MGIKTYPSERNDEYDDLMIVLLVVFDSRRVGSSLNNLIVLESDEPFTSLLLFSGSRTDINGSEGSVLRENEVLTRLNNNNNLLIQVWETQKKKIYKEERDCQTPLCQIQAS
jgi:hypothetical protein